LTTDGTGGSDTGAVFAGTAVHDGVNGDLDGVLVSHDVDNLEAVGDNSDSHELLAVVAAIHHERVGEALDDGALRFPEPLDGISAGRVGDVDGGSDLDIIGERDVPDLNILVTPLVEQLDAANLVGDFLGKDSIARGALDFDFAVRHDCDCAERRPVSGVGGS